VNDAGLITQIGEDLKRWNAIDTGVFLFTPRIFAIVADLMQERGGRCTVTDAVRRLINLRGTWACDVSELRKEEKNVKCQGLTRSYTASCIGGPVTGFLSQLKQGG